MPHLRASLPQQQRWCDHVTPAFPTQQYNGTSVCVHAPTLPSQRLALGMADGERSPLLSDLGDGALGSGNGGVSPGAAPYGVPDKPKSEYPWCSLHPTPASASLAFTLPSTDRAFWLTCCPNCQIDKESKLCCLCLCCTQWKPPGYSLMDVPYRVTCYFAAMTDSRCWGGGIRFVLSC